MMRLISDQTQGQGRSRIFGKGVQIYKGGFVLLSFVNFTRVFLKLPTNKKINLTQGGGGGGSFEPPEPPLDPPLRQGGYLG